MEEEKEPRQESGESDESVNSSYFSKGEIKEAIAISLEE